MSLLALAEPIREAQNDTGEETGFCTPEQESGNIQLRHSAYSPGENRDYAPRDQDALNPDARTDPVEEDVAGDLENEVTPKEYSDQQPKLRTRDRQLGVHRQR